MGWTLPLNSYLVSGVTILFFNFLVFSSVKALCQSICASANLRAIYDLRLALAPRRSRLASFFGGPTGPQPLARFFAVLIAAYALLVVLLDFSVNGSTVVNRVPTVYRSLVRAHPQGQPIIIDYANEYRVLPNDTHLASRRLVALAEAHSCLNLNISHHSMFAYAYRNTHLDKTLIPVETFLEGAVCVTSDRFTQELRMHVFEQIPELGINCSLKGASRIEVQPARSKSVIHDATIIPSVNSTCNLKFHAVQCFKLKTMHCGAVASRTDYADPNFFVLRFENHTMPHKFGIHQLREMDTIPPAHAKLLAANIAFFAAVNFDYGLFNSMYMALSEVVYDVTLVRTISSNVSEINVTIAAPVLTILGVTALALAVAALVMWVKYVYLKDRRKYVTFSTVEEVLAMVRSDGLTKSTEGDTSDQVIFLRGNRPVLMQECWYA